MRKYKIVIVILVASLIALAVQILFGNFLSARLATLPGLRNWNVFNPRAPIVVTNRETVRVSDANDAVETASAVKSKLSLVVYYDGTGSNAKVVLSGGAINWTADGYFVTSKSALPVPNKTYAVILNNGDIYPVKKAYPDTATNLVMLDTDANNLSTIEPVSGADLRPGEKILLILNAMAQNKSTFLESYMHAYSADVSGKEFNSDRDQRTISIQPVGVLAPGQAAIDLSGKLAGMWDGTDVLGADAIRLFANNFFRDNNQALRPSYGFSYKHLSVAEARALQLTPGAQITSVVVGSPAAVGGLQKGDIITDISSETIDDDFLLVDALSNTPPNQPQVFQVQRNGQTITITITPKQL